MAGKAKDNLEKDLLPAEREANKGFSNIETTENGGPDFSKSDYIMKNKNGEPIIATIEMSGSRSKDFTRAFDDVNIPSDQRKKILEDYTWHHVDDYDEATGKCTMQLVQKDAHVATYPHKGSCAQYDSIHGETYNKKYNGKTPKEKAADNGFEINETENGGADFSNTKYLYKIASGEEASIKIKMSGSKYQDKKKVYDKLGISKEEQELIKNDTRVFYLDDFDPDTGECTIQIVNKDAYDIVKNYAGAEAQYKANIGIKYK
ncbi:HNH endonuclease [Clostridium sp.]|uniref:HNH endonuclease signature motif containing protein n=1 Tax=Clostridium sp. TaxID=1506 RepID=UPI002613C1A8|nr:HNH endonuclease [Clostridium sp.]